MKELSENKKHSNIGKRASRTAMLAAIHRFMASRKEHPTFRGPDNLAELFFLPLPRFFCPVRILVIAYARNCIGKFRVLMNM